MKASRRWFRNILEVPTYPTARCGINGNGSEISYDFFGNQFRFILLPKYSTTPGKAMFDPLCLPSSRQTPLDHYATEPVSEGNCLLVGCLTSQQHTSVSQGRICTDNYTRCHTEIEIADPTFYLTQSQYTDTGPTSPSADPIPPGAWQGSHWSANF